MKKGDVISRKRIKAAVKGFVEAELSIVMPDKESELNRTITTTYFEYLSLGKKLANKISGIRNATILLKSGDDFVITLKIGKYNAETIEVTFKKREICFNRI